MYIDKFHFSPFKIEDNVLNIYNGEYIIKDNKIYKNEREISNEIFYNEFVKISDGKWFTNDFIFAFQDKKDAIPDALCEFAVYCDFNLSFLSQKQSNILSNNMSNNKDILSSDKEKTQHSKNSIVTFLIIGWILLFTVREPLNPFYTTLFFIIGMFIISILSIPSFLLKSRLNKNSHFILELVYNVITTTILFNIFKVIL